MKFEVSSCKEKEGNAKKSNNFFYEHHHRRIGRWEQEQYWNCSYFPWSKFVPFSPLDNAQKFTLQRSVISDEHLHRRIWGFYFLRERGNNDRNKKSLKFPSLLFSYLFVSFNFISFTLYLYNYEFHTKWFFGRIKWNVFLPISRTIFVVVRLYLFKYFSWCWN